MPYIRRHGKQLAIVHGEREGARSSVRQRVLFTLCSRAEAEAFAAEGEVVEGTLAWRLEQAYPRLRFDWGVLRAVVRRWAPELPVDHVYPSEAATLELDEALTALLRSLVLLDPQRSAGAREVFEDRRAALGWARAWIDRRLTALDVGEASPADPYDWAMRLHGTDAPADAQAQLASVRAAQGASAAAPLAAELIESFPAFTDALEVLAEAAEQAGDLREALRWVEQLVAVGAHRGATRAGAARWAASPDAREPGRWQAWLAELYLRCGQFDDALRVAEGLRDARPAALDGTLLVLCVQSCSIHNARPARPPTDEIPSECGFIEAILAWRSRDTTAALTHWARAAMDWPRAARRLLNLPSLRPRSEQERADSALGERLRRCLEQSPDRSAWVGEFADFMQSTAMVTAIGEALAGRTRDERFRVGTAAAKVWVERYLSSR